MAAELIKGETGVFEGTAYSYWTGVASTSTVADITGATIRTYIKRNYTDADVDAVLTITGTIVTPASGLFRSAVTAANTNSLTEITDKRVDWYYEHVVKLADGVTYIRSGIGFLTIYPNLGKTLF